MDLSSTGAVPAAVSVERLLRPCDLAAALRQDVHTGLTSDPKWLPPKWFYDDRGSELFASITTLPEYYPTRREREILHRYAREIAAACPANTLVELGSGSSEKTTLLLDALTAQGTLRRFVPFDVCEGALRAAVTRLSRRYPGLALAAIVGDFERHLDAITRPSHGRTLVAFLGGTIGNLDEDQRAVFLSQVAKGMGPGDGLLLGTDLVKDVDRLVAAYDDAAGVTATFNLNVLEVMNRQLGATFDLGRFRHLARWNMGREWMEMRLCSTTDQTVTVPAIGLDVAFAQGEEMRTEISAKFRRSGIEAELEAANLAVNGWWTDPGEDFSISLSFCR